MTKFFDEYGNPNPGPFFGGIVLLVLALVVLFGSFGTVDAGERGVKTKFGEVVGTYEPGLYFKMPIIETVHRMNVRTQTVAYEMDAPLYAASKDQQDVDIAVVINYHIDPSAIAHIYTQYGTTDSYEADVIRPAVRDSIKAAVSKFTAEEITSQRENLSSTSIVLLAERLAEFSVSIERVNITNVKFSPEYTASIEAKVTAEQNALKAENDLARVQFEAQQRIEQAKAEAEAIRIQAEAVTQQGGKDYVQLQAIEKWNGALPNQFVPGSAIPFLSI